MSKEIKLPESVRVGGFNYEIENYSLQEASSSQNFGECSTAMQRIRVDTHFGPVRCATTLLHEILHACCRHGAYDNIESPSEEQTVSQFADVLIQVWQDNPEVMDWIGKHARGE